MGNVKMYNVMGERPGDGGTYSAESAVLALVEHVKKDGYCPSPEEIIRAQLTCRVEGNRTICGDYEIIELDKQQYRTDLTENEIEAEEIC